MLEDGALPERFQFAQPIRTLRAVSQDLTLRATHRLVDGSSVTALAVQWELLTAADRHAERGGLEFVGGEVGHEPVVLLAAGGVGGVGVDEGDVDRAVIHRPVEVVVGGRSGIGSDLFSLESILESAVLRL